MSFLLLHTNKVAKFASSILRVHKVQAIKSFRILKPLNICNLEMHMATGDPSVCKNILNKRMRKPKKK